jgi:hypothetical protein
VDQVCLGEVRLAWVYQVVISAGGGASGFGFFRSVYLRFWDGFKNGGSLEERQR